MPPQDSPPTPLIDPTLEETRTGLQLLLDSVRDYAIFMLDAEGRVATWNSGAERIKGYRAEEIIGQHFSRFYTPEDLARGKPAAHVSAATAEGRFEDEGWRVRKDGSRFWANAVISRICDPAGRLLGFAKVTRDLTDRKLAEAQLAAEKERLAVTLRSIGDAVIATDEARRITVFNSVAEELTGWKAGDAIGSLLDDVFHIVNEETRGPALNPVDRVFREGIVVGLANHTSIVARDGTERPIADSAAPIRDSSGRITGVVLVFRDQTQEREAEQALRESEQRIRVKLDSVLSPEGDLGRLELADIIDARALHSMMDEFNKLARIPLAIIDVKGNVLVGVGWQDICTRFHRVNPETCRHCVESDTQLAAASPGQVKLYKCKNNMWDIATPIAVGGQHLGNVFMGQFFFADEAVDEDLFRSQARRYGFDEEEYLAALAAVPRLSRDSVTAAMSFFLKFADMLSNLSFSNIKLARSSFEREALMKSLQDNKERLEESDRRKTDFLAVLSHELRNPLAPIRNSIHLLDRAAPDSEQAARSREVIRRQSGQLSRLVDDLLDVTRISRGKIVLRPSLVDARELVQRACDDHRSLFHGRGIELRVETSDPAWVEVDETRIAQVVGNLLQNAAKFSEAGGAVTASVCIAGEAVEIRVRDEGVGITPELLPLVFEPFVQADGGLARTKGGLGLGLALVKGLVELQGGSVRAHSKGERRGAEFVVSLPLAAAPRLPAPAPLPAVVARPMEILVIEDNLDAAQSLAEVLEMEGHRVHVANDGRSGIAKARELKPDVVLCDIGLPDVDGYEIARMLRVDGELHDTRLIALSGYAQPEDRQRAAEAGFDAHIPKPPSLRTLFQLLSAAEVREP